MTLLDQIRRLQQKINKLTADLEKANKDLVLKANDCRKIREKEVELNELKTQLEACQRERDKINSLLGDKIEELNKSNLSKEEKVEKVSSLMTHEYLELKSACRKLTKNLHELNIARDKLIELLESKIKLKKEVIKDLKESKKNTWITIWILLGIIVLFSISMLLQALQKQKKAKNK